MNAFTRCPNGDPGQGLPHDFFGYQPGEHDPDKRPLMFCERCGEVRALTLPRQEPAMVAKDLNEIATTAAAAFREEA